MIQRESYIQQTSAFADKPLVKIPTGILRCGKSSVLMQIKEALLSKNTLPKRIIHVNYRRRTHIPIADFFVKRHILTSSRKERND